MAYEDLIAQELLGGSRRKEIFSEDPWYTVGGQVGSLDVREPGAKPWENALAQILTSLSGGIMKGYGQASSENKYAKEIASALKLPGASADERRSMVDESPWLGTLATARDLGEQANFRDLQNQATLLGIKQNMEYGPVGIQAGMPQLERDPQTGAISMNMDYGSPGMATEQPQQQIQDPNAEWNRAADLASGITPASAQAAAAPNPAEVAPPDSQRVGRSVKDIIKEQGVGLDQAVRIYTQEQARLNKVPRPLLAAANAKIEGALDMEDRFAPLLKIVEQLEQRAGPAFKNYTGDVLLKMLPTSEVKNLYQWIEFGGLEQAVAMQGRQLNEKELGIIKQFMADPSAVALGDLSERLKYLTNRGRRSAAHALEVAYSQPAYRDSASGIAKTFFGRMPADMQSEFGPRFGLQFGSPTPTPTPSAGAQGTVVQRQLKDGRMVNVRQVAPGKWEIVP